MSLIEVKNLSKHFKVLNRREGLRGSIKDLFSQSTHPELVNSFKSLSERSFNSPIMMQADYYLKTISWCLAS